jgi:hypothetical protein
MLTASSKASASAKLSSVGCTPFVAAAIVWIDATFLSPRMFGADPSPSSTIASSLTPSMVSRWSFSTCCKGGVESSNTSFETCTRCASLRGVAVTLENVGSPAVIVPPSE